MVSPKPMRGGGRRSLVISCESTFASPGARPPPPYSLGQLGAVQPLSAMRRSQVFIPGTA